MSLLASTSRFATRIAHVLRTNGIGAILHKVENRLSPQGRAYRRHKADEDRQFDAVGYDTGGIQRIYGMETVGGNAASGGNHIAVSPRHFHDALAALDIPYDGFTFIDLGSGKGRAVLMAADLPFARAIGVEFAAELHHVAEANLANRAERVGQDPRIEFIHGDAAQFEFPDEPTILFTFNPFDPPVLTDVIDRAMASWRKSPRPFRVIYLLPLHQHEWEKGGWRLLKSSEGMAIFGPPETET